MLYNISAIRELERLAIETYGMTGATLMQNAGRAAFDLLKKRWPEAKRILLFCGKGNNGGDGYVVAKLAAEHGLEVSVRYIGDLGVLKGMARDAMQACQQAGIELKPFNANESPVADVIVDALLGIGLQGKVHCDYRTAIAVINKTQRPVLAIDIPSGLETNTGNVLGDAVKAETTITFIGLKQGLFTGQASTHCGEVICDDLEVPHEAYTKVQPTADFIGWNEVKEVLPTRKNSAHKGNFGHVLIIGGNYGMGGAARMAAEAAARAGAGLVTVATRPEHVTIVSGTRPELMCRGVTAVSDIQDLLTHATAIVLGPGLGQDDWARTLFNSALKTKQPKVLDADALNMLATTPCQQQDWILTPHPGEAARLLNEQTQQIQADRFAACEKIQAQYGGICVLKGAGTLVKGKKFIGVCTKGNPGMASGGMGDVLSGLLGGLLAQGLSLEQAARVGVLIHAMAADEAAIKQGERGMLALDLMLPLHKLVNP